jgi:hypothetical protein
VCKRREADDTDESWREGGVGPHGHWPTERITKLEAPTASLSSVHDRDAMNNDLLQLAKTQRLVPAAIQLVQRIDMFLDPVHNSYLGPGLAGQGVSEGDVATVATATPAERRLNPHSTRPLPLQVSRHSRQTCLMKVGQCLPATSVHSRLIGREQ